MQGGFETRPYGPMQEPWFFVGAGFKPARNNHEY